MSEHDNIPSGSIKSQYITLIKVRIDNTNISRDAFVKSLFVFNNALEKSDIILKRIEIYGYEKQLFELSILTSAMERLDRKELRSAIEEFLTEYLNLPTVEVKSVKFDYLNRIKSLKYFKDNFMHEEEPVKDFQTVYKAKM